MAIPYGSIMESLRARQIQIAEAKAMREQQKRERTAMMIQLGGIALGTAAGLGAFGPALGAGAAATGEAGATTGLLGSGGAGLGSLLKGSTLGASAGSLLGGAVTGTRDAFSTGLQALNLAADIYNREEDRATSSKIADSRSAAEDVYTFTTDHGDGVVERLRTTNPETARNYRASLYEPEPTPPPEHRSTVDAALGMAQSADPVAQQRGSQAVGFLGTRKKPVGFSSDRKKSKASKEVAPPKVGEVRNGYVYLGGPPGEDSSWILVR